MDMVDDNGNKEGTHKLELVDEQLINVSIQVILCIFNVYICLIGENKSAIITQKSISTLLNIQTF